MLKTREKRECVKVPWKVARRENTREMKKIKIKSSKLEISAVEFGAHESSIKRCFVTLKLRWALFP